MREDLFDVAMGALAAVLILFVGFLGFSLGRHYYKKESRPQYKDVMLKDVNFRIINQQRKIETWHDGCAYLEPNSSGRFSCVLFDYK